MFLESSKAAYLHAILSAGSFSDWKDITQKRMMLLSLCNSYNILKITGLVEFDAMTPVLHFFNATCNLMDAQYQI